MTKNLLLFLLILLALTPTEFFGQGANRGISNDYTRSSISEVYVNYSDWYNSDIQKSFQNRLISDKFDINEIPLKYITSSDSRTTKKEDSYISVNKTASLTKVLNEANVGLSVVSYTFNRTTNGKMDLSKVHERGLYTAKDTDITLSSAKIRGLFEVEDFGHELINNSYVIVYDYVNVRLESDDTGEHYRGQAVAYLFQLQWSDGIESQIFDAWIDDDTPQSEIKSRIAAYNDIQVPVKCVLRATANATSIKDKTSDFNTWLQQANNNITFAIQKEHAAFSVTSAITNLNPIRSKIGLKEGLKPGTRFYVYDNVMRANGNIGKSRQGVLRATHKIVDNRHVATGQNPESEFRQIAGKRLDTGQSLVEKRDRALSIAAGLSSTMLHGQANDSIAGNTAGFHADVAYEIFGKSKMVHYAMLSLDLEGSALSFALSYNFGWNFRALEVLPYVGFGADSYMVPAEANLSDEIFGAWFLQAGLRTHINIVYPLQFFLSCGWNQQIFEGEVHRELSGTVQKYEIEGEDGAKLKSFTFRELNGLHMQTGLRFCF